MTEKELLAEALGVEVEELRDIPRRMVRVMRAGVIVELKIGRWRGKTTLTAEDLGIPETEEYQEWLSLGVKRLWPAKIMQALNACEYNARYYLSQYAHKTYWGWFVPARAWGDLKPILEARRQRYFKTAERLLDEYEVNAAAVLERYRDIANIAFDRAVRLGTADEGGRDEYVSRLVNEIASRIPAREALRASFRFEWDMYYIPLAVELPEEGDDLEEARLRREVQEKLQSEREALLNELFADVKGTLAGMIYDAVCTLHDSIMRNGGLQPRNLRQVYDLIDRLQAINLSRDTEIDDVIDQLRLIAQSARVGREQTGFFASDALAKLTDIATVMRAQLVSLRREVRASRELVFGDAPTPAAVRSARNKLGLSTSASAEITRRGKRNIIGAD